MASKYEGNDQETLGNNMKLFVELTQDLKDKLEAVSNLPFYSGSEFKLPDTNEEADKMINEVGGYIDTIAGFSDNTSFKESQKITFQLEEESNDTSLTYKKLTIRGMILIHWKYYYLEKIKNGETIDPPSRIDFIMKILDKLYKCSTDVWGKPSEFKDSTITNVLNPLANGEELDIVMMNFPIKALHIYGW